MPRFASYLVGDGVQAALNRVITGCGRQCVIMPITSNWSGESDLPKERMALDANREGGLQMSSWTRDQELNSVGAAAHARLSIIITHLVIILTNEGTAFLISIDCKRNIRAIVFLFILFNHVFWNLGKCFHRVHLGKSILSHSIA